MADLNQFLNKDLSADDVLHSSGYANVAGGAGAGGLSMDQRRSLGRKEIRVVGDYRRSELGSRMAGSKARTADQNRGRVYDPNTDGFEDSARTTNRENAAIKDRNKIDTSIEKRQHFIEPSSRPAPRGYDKFA